MLSFPLVAVLVVVAIFELAAFVWRPPPHGKWMRRLVGAINYGAQKLMVVKGAFAPATTTHPGREFDANRI